MALKKYVAVVNGWETVLNLTPEDAEARGLASTDEVKPRQAKRAAAPKNKAAAAEADKAEQPVGDVPDRGF